MKAKLLILLLPAAALFMTACEVDESYDLGQKPDLSMTFFEEGLAVPIGNSTGFKLGDFITPGTELTVDAGGYYSVSISGNPSISQNVSIPSVSVSNIACTDASFEFPIPAEINAIPAATWAALVTDYPYVLDEQEATIKASIEAEEKPQEEEKPSTKVEDDLPFGTPNGDIQKSYTMVFRANAFDYRRLTDFLEDTCIEYTVYEED